MLKNLKRASAIMLSLAMAVQFGMADTYFANTLSEEPIIEETHRNMPILQRKQSLHYWKGSRIKGISKSTYR